MGQIYHVEMCLGQNVSLPQPPPTRVNVWVIYFPLVNVFQQNNLSIWFNIFSETKAYNMCIWWMILNVKNVDIYEILQYYLSK